MEDNAVSPVIGIILLTAVTVALVSLAAFFVFDVGQSNSAGVGTASVGVDYNSESSISVQLIKGSGSEDVIVRSALGTEYVLDGTGDTVTLLNQEGNKTPIVLAEKNGERTVIREVPPRSFTPDIVVSKDGTDGQYTTIQTALNNAGDGDIVVLKQGVYFENIDISTSNITLVGETGTVIADNTSDSTVVDIDASGVQVANVQVNATSSQGGNAAEYGIQSSTKLTAVQTTVKNSNTSNTAGDIELSDTDILVPRERINKNTTVAKDTGPIVNGLIAYGTEGGDNLIVQDPETKTIETKLTNAGSDVRSVAWSPNNNRIAYGSFDGNIYVYNTTSGKIEHTLSDGGSKGFLSVEWRPDGTQIAGASGNNNIAVFNSETGTLAENLTDPSSTTTGVQWGPDGSQLAASSYDNNVYIYDTSDYTLNQSIAENSSVLTVRWRPDGTQIAYGTGNGNVLVRNTSDYSLAQNLSRASDFVAEVSWRPDNSQIAFGSADQTVYIYDTESYVFNTSVTDGTKVASIGYSPNSSKLAYGGNDANLYIYNTSDYTKNATISDASGYVVGLDWQRAD